MLNRIKIKIEKTQFEQCTTQDLKLNSLIEYEDSSYNLMKLYLVITFVYTYVKFRKKFIVANYK